MALNFKHCHLARLSLLALLAIGLSGCSTYDYMQHTDRVGYKAGNAVKANLEMQTINPSKKSMNNVTGLGKNGDVTSAKPGTSTDTEVSLTAI